ncbi:MAG: D-galactonate dehydratase family member [Verrucomicrobia subdivision 3 bacterium]|nr:D-galactonate dehydratase family member [Limisphaerales bacterium]MCS1417460.1 D-galactonate dehydratase family member [Limisphaerales bacterium]
MELCPFLLAKRFGHQCDPNRTGFRALGHQRQTRRQPVYQLLGGKVRDAVPLYTHGGGSSVSLPVLTASVTGSKRAFRHIQIQWAATVAGDSLDPGKEAGQKQVSKVRSLMRSFT